MFPVVEVPDHAANLTESLGTKPKFWFEKGGVDFLFKEGWPDSGEDWSEKIASELCNLLGLPHANYDLAVWNGRKGVVSPNFVPRGGRLVHGNELLAKILSQYPERKFYKVRQHNLRIVMTIVKDIRIMVPIGWDIFAGVTSAVDVFVGYLMLDAWIANQDRHHGNWALVVNDNLHIHLAPSYDHASCLGRNETDKDREDRLVTRDKRRGMQRYVEKANSAFYMRPKDPYPMSTFEAFRAAFDIHPVAAKSWLLRLENISFRDVQSLFEQIPHDRINDVAIKFAMKIIELNQQRLLTLKET
ncbi:MAG: hypothetical protein HZA08_05555 [Nitrospirae bacterium]|nr:hypothetical protein [Nitrospirota bacterium]